MAKSMLVIRCHGHKGYRGARKPGWKCDGCDLLYILVHQFEKDPGRYLGGLNPYQFINDVDRAYENLEVRVIAT